MSKGKFRLPPDHRPAMRVPHGGSCCANCRYYDPSGDSPNGRCGEPNYAAYYGTDEIPEKPTEFCSDWYEPGDKPDG